MSGSNSVGGSGSVDVSSSPYTSGASGGAGLAGQTKDGRRVTSDPDAGKTYIPAEPEKDRPLSTSLSKRKIEPHAGGKKLKNMPDGGYKPLREKQESSTPQRKDSQAAQEPQKLSLKPQVTVSTAPPPLTAEQEKTKNKIAGALTTALGFVKQHKNSFAMGGGAALTIAGIAFMAFPPTAMIGIFPAVIGFTMLTTGFSFAMTNTDSGGPTPSTPPSTQPKNKNENNEEEDGKKKKSEPAEGSSSSSSSPSTAAQKSSGGHFAKIDHPRATVPELTESEETSGEMMAKKRRQQPVNSYKQHMMEKLRAAIREDAQRRVELENGERASESSDLVSQVIDLVAEMAVREGFSANEEVLSKIAESGRLIARAMAEVEGRPVEQQQKVFQDVYASLIKDFNVSKETIELLCAGFDDILEQEQGLSEAVKAMLSSTSALLKAIMDGRDASERKMVSQEDLDAAIASAGGQNNRFNVRALQIALEGQGNQITMDNSEFEQVKGRLYRDALDLLPKRMSGEEFRAAMIEKVDSRSRPEDYALLNKALNDFKWLDDSSQ